MSVDNEHPRLQLDSALSTIYSAQLSVVSVNSVRFSVDSAGQTWRFGE